MIASHEIPNGSRLYFGESAKLKREIESKASEILLGSGYEEIVTPNFTYTQYQDVDDLKDVIRLSGETNKTLALRADSTLDVVRLITSRLGRSTDHKKWFYIQPIFHYPSSEVYQIGLEEIGSLEMVDKLTIMIKMFEAMKVSPVIQLSHIKIPNLLIEHYGVKLDDLQSNNLQPLLEHKEQWIRDLITIHKKEDLERVMPTMPEMIQAELGELVEVCDAIAYDNIVIAPLYYAKMKYYDSLFFRAFVDNNVLARGGRYKDDGVDSSGFAIYTDNLLEEVIEGAK
jgi:ATP phosphoribosyltransferase regulatory subunit HisZ